MTPPHRLLKRAWDAVKPIADSAQVATSSRRNVLDNLDSWDILLTETYDKELEDRLDMSYRHRTFDAYERESRDRMWAAISWAKKCVPAGTYDMARWMDGYVSRGGEVDYERDRGMTGVYVLCRDAEITRLCGAMSIDVIVPRSVDVDVRDRGHATIYYMDGYHADGRVELFEDVREMMPSKV